MVETKWVAVQVRYPEEIWNTGRDEFRIRVCERGGRFLPDGSRAGEVVVTLVSPHKASTAAEAAIRGIEATQDDGLSAGIGMATALNVEVLDRKPSGASYEYKRSV